MRALPVEMWRIVQAAHLGCRFDVVGEDCACHDPDVAEEVVAAVPVRRNNERYGHWPRCRPGRWHDREAIDGHGQLHWPHCCHPAKFVHWRSIKVMKADEAVPVV